MPRLDPNLFAPLLARRHAVTLGLAVLAGLFALSGGMGDGIDRLLRAGRDAIRTHAASGEVQIVEIDARSIDDIARWPWPRRHHAELIDRLSAAGVRSIAFDVDFSARSNPRDDAAMAAALERADGSVALATFRQRSSATGTGEIENIPIDAFRTNAFLAGVNIVPDADGQVRRMLLGVETGGAPRPALAAMIAEQQAEIGRAFAIDYAIDPGSIPRHSFIDVIRGRVPATELRDKRIIVGATAIEMGDRYAVPGHGVIPGVVIQALAAETLMARGVPTEGGALWPLILAALVVAATVRPGPAPRRIAGFALGSLGVLALPLATEQWLALSFEVGPGLALLAAAGLLALGLHFADRFRRRALADAETGLPNLAALVAAASDGVVVVARIDRFAAIAAGLGPAATVNLIHRVADRLGFGEARVIYRIDEASLAWIEAEEGGASLHDRLEALAALMRSPIDCGRLVDVTLAFGIAGPVAAGPKQQVANASLAAERAARRGSRWEHFVEGASAETDWHLSLLGELDTAIAAGEVWNAYQPKLDIASGRIIGVEALVRWDHAERGRISPDDFIPVVEQAGRIADLTAHVFARALRDCAHWRAAGHELGVAINVSATLLLDDGLVARVRRALERSTVPAQAITLEVTESAAMVDPERAVAALEDWRALGLAVSIDDYGTGQSSLGYLQKLPASELKIDKSFVGTIATDPRNAAMVRSTVALAHELGMKVVAEGVEDEPCLAALAAMGCDTAQGWLIGKPMPADDFLAFVSERRKAAA